jgi:hypothetical protein
VQSPEKTVGLPQSDILTERIGTRIGRYKLLQQIGEGGSGVVFMAEQTLVFFLSPLAFLPGNLAIACVDRHR